MEKTPNQLHYLNNSTDSTCCQVYNPVLNAPCVFCGYNGEKYWQKETHSKHCPFYKIGGISDRERELRGIVKIRAEFYSLMKDYHEDWATKYYKE